MFCVTTYINEGGISHSIMSVLQGYPTGRLYSCCSIHRVSKKCSPILIMFGNIAAEKIYNLLTYFFLKYPVCVWI